MLPYLTAGIPGIGGTIKDSNEDFIVEEIPAYAPCGSGTHLYLTIEKHGITTPEAIRRIARQIGANEKDVGYAGLKDAAGITRQTFSLEHIDPTAVEGLELDKLKVLAVSRHTNKLKLGHLKGNRFTVVVRGISDQSPENTQQVLDILRQRGVPNYFGFQRYGSQGTSHLIGEAMLRREWKLAVDRLIGTLEAVRDDQWRRAIETYHRGDMTEAAALMPRHCRTEAEVLRKLASRPGEWEKAFSLINIRLRKLYLSAFQSYLFDRVVEQRIDMLDVTAQGDLAWKHINGACFLVEDAEAEAPRAASFEISPSGPMFGAKMTWPEGNQHDLERHILAISGIRPEQFDLGNGLRLDGERRPLRVPLSEPSFSINDSNLTISFALPRGSYATSVLREIMKNGL